MKHRKLNDEGELVVMTKEDLKELGLKSHFYKSLPMGIAVSILFSGLFIYSSINSINELPFGIPIAILGGTFIGWIFYLLGYSHYVIMNDRTIFGNDMNKLYREVNDCEDSERLELIRDKHLENLELEYGTHAHIHEILSIINTKLKYIKTE